MMVGLSIATAGCGKEHEIAPPKPESRLEAKDPAERGAAAKAAGDKFGAPEEDPNNTNPPGEKPDTTPKRK